MQLAIITLQIALRILSTILLCSPTGDNNNNDSISNDNNNNNGYLRQAIVPLGSPLFYPSMSEKS